MKKNVSGLSPMDCALSYLTARDRTVREMQQYLDKKDYGEADVDAAIERLKELGLLDDRRFAERFIKTRLASKPLSRAHLYRQLMEHGIDAAIVSETLDALTDDGELENALAVARKFYRQFTSLEPEKRRQRVLMRLQSRGFGYEMSQKAFSMAEREETE